MMANNWTHRCPFVTPAGRRIGEYGQPHLGAARRRLGLRHHTWENAPESEFQQIYAGVHVPHLCIQTVTSKDHDWPPDPGCSPVLRIAATRDASALSPPNLLRRSSGRKALCRRHFGCFDNRDGRALEQVGRGISHRLDDESLHDVLHRCRTRPVRIDDIITTSEQIDRYVIRPYAANAYPTTEEGIPLAEFTLPHLGFDSRHRLHFTAIPSRKHRIGRRLGSLGRRLRPNLKDVIVGIGLH
jgi:hypothetical protein